MKKLDQLYKLRYGIKAPLRGYQLQAARVGVTNDAFALLMDPRLGKTRVAIAVMGYRRRVHGIQRAVVICPAIAKDVWETELADTLALPHRITTVNGKAAERRLQLVRWKDEPGKLSIIIVNHEATWRLKRWLYKINAEFVVVDESHRIKNHAAKQSRSIHTLGKRSVYRCIMTGTFTSEPRDAFSQFKFLDPSLLGERWKEDFCGRFVRTWGYGGHAPASYHRLEELNQIVDSVSFKLTRAEAGGFPVEQEQVIPFDLSPVCRRHYDEMNKKLVTLVQGTEVTASIVLTQALRMQQITGGFLPVPQPDQDLAVNTQLGPERVRTLMELVSEYPKKEPLVIPALFRYEIEMVVAAMKKAGRSVNFIVGGMGDARDQAKKDFQSGKVDTCVIQIRAGGIAIDLSRASTMVFYSLTPSLIDYEQVKARILSRRGGSVSLLYLCARDTTDEDGLTSLRERRSLAELIVKRLKKS